MLTRGRFSGQGAYVYESLRDMILVGRIRPGTRITIREIAEQLGSSTGPVRDALIQLSNEMLVQGGHGQDWRVPRMTPQLVEEGMMVREALESQSARHAASRATEEDIKRLRSLAEQIDARVGAGLVHDEITSDLDRQLHLMIADVAGSSLLQVEIGRWKIVMSWAQLCLGGESGRIESHVKLVDAIASGDADFADRQMRRHIRYPWAEIKSHAEKLADGEPVIPMKEASAGADED